MTNATANERGRGVIDRYRTYLPVSAATPVVSLGEGATPLIHSPSLARVWGAGARSSSNTRA